MKKTDDYVKEIMNIDSDSERNTYSFTCSNKTIEERAIMTYINYLKDNNVAYGRFLKDVLYNGAIDSFDLSLPRKSSSVTIGAKSSNLEHSNVDVDKLVKLTNQLLIKVDSQDRQLTELSRLVSEQTELIKALSNVNVTAKVVEDSTAATITDNDDFETSEEELRAQKERDNMRAEMQGQTIASMFPGM